MISFTHSCQLDGVNTGQPLTVPMGAKGVILQSADSIMIALMEPEDFRGIICQGPADIVKRYTEVIGDEEADIRLEQHRGLGHEIAEIADALRHRGSIELASELEDLLLRS